MLATFLVISVFVRLEQQIFSQLVAIECCDVFDLQFGTDSIFFTISTNVEFSIRFQLLIRILLFFYYLLPSFTELIIK